MKNLKNIAIILLMVTAFGQLSNIWNINVQNFFNTDYSLSYNEEVSQEILMPNKVLVKSDGLFKIAYNTKVASSTNISELSVLKDVADVGVFLGNENNNLESLTKIADIIYRYPSVIDHSLIGEVFNTKNSQFSKNDVAFDNAFIDTDENKIYFYNSTTEETFPFSVKQLNLATNYMFNENIGFVYNENDINFLVPLVLKREYSGLVETNPYLENNEILVSTVESKINKYFKSPSEKWTMNGEECYIFAGEDITVKYYYNKNVLEYKNNFVSKDKTDTAEAYAIAKAFIKSDELVKNELILKDFTKSESSYIFSFNPIQNNTEIVFDSVDSEDLEYYIQIEVTNGIVKEYKKFVMNYDTDTKNINIIEDYDVYALEEHFDSVDLVYVQSLDTNTVKLCWAITFGEDTMYTEAD